MKKVLLFITAAIITLNCISQKTTQTLQSSRLSIFKNGTYFIKRSARVNVINNTFTIAAPTNVLMGSYWLATGKETGIKSIVVKQDTFKILHTCNSINDYLKASINKQVVLTKNNCTVTKTLSGLLLSFNEINNFIKVKTVNDKIILASSNDFDEISIASEIKDNFYTDSIAPIGYHTCE